MKRRTRTRGRVGGCSCLEAFFRLSPPRLRLRQPAAGCGDLPLDPADPNRGYGTNAQGSAGQKPCSQTSLSFIQGNTGAAGPTSAETIYPMHKLDLVLFARATGCVTSGILARRGEPADTRGDVHSAAVDVPFFADHVAGVQAQVQREARLVSGATARYCRLNRLPSGSEDGENPSPRSFPSIGMPACSREPLPTSSKWSPSRADRAASVHAGLSTRKGSAPESRRTLRSCLVSDSRVAEHRIRKRLAHWRSKGLRP